jgi:putative chitinase
MNNLAVIPINQKKFYDTVRQELFKGSIVARQFDGMSAILSTWKRSKMQDIRWLAYMLATVYHETAHTMSPIEEYGQGRGRKYGKMLKMDGTAYTTPKKIYYGRGLVQLTWYENYKNMGKLLKVDLLNKPELALDHQIAIDILFEGMTRGKSSFGDFTGKSLEDYFTATIDDPIGARHIINGRDCDKMIAGYHNIFLKALT